MGSYIIILMGLAIWGIYNYTTCSDLQKTIEKNEKLYACGRDARIFSICLFSQSVSSVSGVEWCFNDGLNITYFSSHSTSTPKIECSKICIIGKETIR